MLTEETFKHIPRLRWRLDDDRTAVATACRNPYRRDHLYWHGPGRLGIYYQAETRYAASARVRRYRRLIREAGGRLLEHRRGDLEGLLVFQAGPSNVPEVFLKSEARAEACRIQVGNVAQNPIEPGRRPVFSPRNGVRGSDGP